MEKEVIFIYCLADCAVNAISFSDHSQSLMPHAEIITFVMVSALYYGPVGKSLIFYSCYNSEVYIERYV